MCGVIGGHGEVDSEALARLEHRGPDASGTWQGERYWLGHRRLSIQDLDRRSDQPMKSGRTILSYNGELWNHAALRAELEHEGAKFKTTGDTEVVAHALDHWGEAALPRFQGMFALAWSSDGGCTVRLARDRFGEVPLHLCARSGRFASEAKALAGSEPIEWVEPGTVVELGDSLPVVRRWYDLQICQVPRNPDQALRSALEIGVEERLIGDVGFCLLLSGGLDSSCVALVAAARTRGQVEAYVARGAADGSDVKVARVVAAELGLRLHEVQVADPTADDLTGVIESIEMPHKAQVEIGWACAALADRIRADGHRVVLSGEGSDELWASYGMAYHGIRAKGWDGFRRELYTGQHRKNFARCNKIFMRRGIECRLPFLSTGVAELGLSLPPEAVRDGNRPKAILERAFPELPRVVLERSKVTFQDGAGLQKACARAVSDSTRYYRAEHSRLFPSMVA